MKLRPRSSASHGVSQVSLLITAAVMAAVAASAAAQRQFEELGKRGLPADRDDTRSTVLGDVDGDGDLDLVVGNGGQNRLYLNNGTGTFSDATPSRMPAGSHNTTSLALGDVDGDGALDLVVGNWGQQNRLYLNNGTGTFTDATAFRMPGFFDQTSSLALGDVDGDGDLDLVVGNRGQQNRLYQNDGTGTFTDATASRMPIFVDQTTSLALGDVDGDGDLDLVVGNRGQQNRLYQNDGTGTFTDATAARMPVFIDQTTSVALGDVDRDGDLDLVVGNSGSSGGQSRLYLNNGTFTDATATRMPVGMDSTSSLALGDVDRDGDLDLILGNSGYFGGQSRLYLNNGTGTFRDATTSRMPVFIDQTTSVALGDVDGDGDLDLILENSGYFGGQNRLYLNDGTGTFTDATASRMPVANDFTTSLATGDVDGDGDLDLVVGNKYGESRLYLNSGTGTFTDATASRMPGGHYYTSSVALGDVDGDGDLDLVVGITDQYYYYALGGQSRLYLNNGTGTFTDATASRMPGVTDWTTSLALGDVDGDGDLDLVIGNTRNAGVLSRGGLSRLYLNNGTGKFTDATGSRMPVGIHDTRSVALGDVDGDGDLDLVAGNGGRYGGQNRLYLNNGTGTGTFTDATAFRMPVGIHDTRSVALGDVDGDGDLDLVVGNLGQQSRLYLNDGTGTFTDATASRMPLGIDSTSSLALGDVDRDGDLDLFVGSGTYVVGGQSRLYLNNGTGTFTDATAARMPVIIDRTSSLALGDVDRDGDLDLFVGNLGGRGQQNRLYQNLLRQLDAPYVLHIGRNYQLDVYSRYGPATVTETALPFLSTATANIPLPPFGILGIDPTWMVALPPFAVAQPAGIGSLTIPVPTLTDLAGLTIYTQVVLDQQPVQVRLTNVAGDIIRR